MITTTTGAKKMEGSDNWRQIIPAHNDTVEAYDDAIATQNQAIVALNNHIKNLQNYGSLANGASKTFDFDWHDMLSVIFIGRAQGSRAGLYYIDADGGVVTVIACSDVTVTFSNAQFTISNAGANVYYRILNEL